jgi:hypothetical protein
VSDVICAASADGVSLSWNGADLYEAVSVFRNDRLLARLAGEARSYLDPLATDLFTVYTVLGEQGGVQTLPVSCSVNEFTSAFVLRAEDVHASPGDRNVPVRILATNPVAIQGVQLAVRVDPAAARLRDLTIEGTETEAFGFAFFASSEFAPGVRSAGLMVSFTSSRFFPARADWHVMTALVDIPADAPMGVVRTEFISSSAGPQAWNLFSVHGQDNHAETRPGSLLVGPSPVEEVAVARAVEAAAEDGGGADAQPGSAPGILIEWQNPATYDGIRIERDGGALVEIAGDATSFHDAGAGPGRHHYRVIARRRRELPRLPRRPAPGRARDLPARRRQPGWPGEPDGRDPEHRLPPPRRAAARLPGRRRRGRRRPAERHGCRHPARIPLCEWGAPPAPGGRPRLVRPHHG